MLRLVFFIVLISLVSSQVGIKTLFFPGQDYASSELGESNPGEPSKEESKKDPKPEIAKFDKGILLSSLQLPVYFSLWNYAIRNSDELQSVDLSSIHRPPELFV